MSKRIYTQEEIEAALKYDAIGTAEQIVGRRWNEGTEAEKRDTGFLAIDLQMKHAAVSERMLKSVGDTTFTMDTGKYIDAITKFGFRQVYKLDFNYFNQYDKTPHEESMLVFFKEPALLLKFDTFRGHRDGGKVHYFWKPDSDEYERECLSSCSWSIISPERRRYYEKCDFTERDLVWKEAKRDHDICVIGDHDCREALFLKLNRLERNGSFIPWFGNRVPWLCHSMDFRDDNGGDMPFQAVDSYAIGIERANQFPDDVKQALAVSEWVPKKPF